VYDSVGNRIQVAGSWARTLLPQSVSSTIYDGANRLLQWNERSLVYDANGNLRSDGLTSYDWNARNQLTAIAGSSGTSSFAYDAMSRRVSKTTNGQALTSLYDGVNPVHELASGTPVFNLLTGLSAGERFLISQASLTQAILTDALGSVIALIDDESGQIGSQYTYEAYGRSAFRWPDTKSLPLYRPSR
jgi:YD repeat-containing protein